MTEPADHRVDYSSALLESERWVGLTIKWILLVVGLLSTRFWETYRGFTLLGVGVLGYLALNLLFTYLFGTGSSLVRRMSPGIYFVSYASDLAFASLVMYYSGDLRREMFILHALLAYKSAIYYPAWHEILVFPFALGPLHVLTLRLSVGNWYFLTQESFLVRYVLLFAVVLVVVYLGWFNERSHLRETALDRALAERAVDLDNKSRAMQQMAINLGNRVLELRTLQEGIKAITSALALEDVLRLIVANASQVLEGARCSVALLDGERDEMVSMSASDEPVELTEDVKLSFDGSVAEWVVQNGKPVLSGEVRQDTRFAFAAGLSVCSVISVPLFLDDRAVGALIATSSERDAFTGEDLGRLNAFADQATVAVKNARLYEKLVQEERQTAQLYQHMQERRDELEALLRGIGDGVIVTDPNLNLLLMNAVAARIFRVTSDVVSSVPLGEIIPHEQLLSLFEDALGGEEEAVVREISLPSTDDDGEEVYQAMASSIWSASGQVRAVITVLRDITTQKELERMKSNFLSVVSHELKTPLHSIKGFVDIILMGKTGQITETQTDFLSTVRDQTTHLQSLINDLLEFSRLESGQVQLRLTDVSLAEVATAVVEQLKPLADEGQIRLENRVRADTLSVQADRMRIEQVLTNLIDNAIKFTPADGVVTVDATDLGKDIQVTVSDTGIGIPADQLTSVFDRFYQVDGGSTRHYRGTGLGLTICKHIVEHHRGRMWVESEEGMGSTFFFVLPKRIAAEEDRLVLDFLSLPNKDRE